MSEFVVWNPWYSAYKQRIAAVYRCVKPIFLLWLVLRIALSSLALIASLVAPRTVSEQQIHVWPVAVPSGAWLERVLLLPWQWMISQYQWPALFTRWRSLLALLLLPAALLAWIVYRAVALSDVIINLEQPHTLIYSFLISKSSAQVVPVQGFLPPWQTLRAAFISLNGSGSQSTLIELVMGGIVLLLFILGWRLLWRLRPSYLLYTFVILLVSFSYYTGPSLPYMGLQRHCLLAFPIFLPLAIWGRWRIVNWAVLFYGSIGTIILVVGYGSLTWVP